MTNLVKNWKLTTAGVARFNSNAGKNSKNIYIAEKLIKTINSEINKACADGNYVVTVNYDKDFDIGIIETKLISNGYSIKHESYNGGLGRRLVISWEEQDD